MANKITPEICKSFRTDFKNAVKQLEEQYGIILSIGSIRYDSKSFKTTMIARTLENELNRTIDSLTLTTRPEGITDEMRNARYKCSFRPNSVFKVIGQNGNNYTIETNRGKVYRILKDRFNKDFFKI